MSIKAFRVPSRILMSEMLGGAGVAVADREALLDAAHRAPGHAPTSASGSASAHGNTAVAGAAPEVEEMVVGSGADGLCGVFDGITSSDDDD